MESIKLYQTIPEVYEMLAGDTVGITVRASGLTNGATMRFLLEEQSVPGSTALSKNAASAKEDGVTIFTVQLTSADTAGLCGTYRMHFVFEDTGGNLYRKLTGTLRVLPVPVEV